MPITATFTDTPPERPVRFRRKFAVARRARTSPALRVRTRRSTPSSATARRSVTTSSRRAGRATTTDSVTRRSTSRTPSTRARTPSGITVAEGWYRGRLGFRGGRREVYGTDTGPIAQLELCYDDGTIDTVATDRHWRAGLGPHLSASLYDGDTYDARLAEPEWSTPAFDDRDWVDASELASVAHLMTAPTGPPVRRIETMRPVSISASPGGATIVDFGQNISGRVRFSVDGPAGDTVMLHHAEVLEHGELGTRPLRGAAQTDTYVLAGGGVETYEPLFTIHGFRYVQVDGWPGELDDRCDRGRRVPLRHGADRHVPLVARRAQPAPPERALEHARQLRRPADRLSAARRAPRLDRRHPGVRTDRLVPVRLQRLPHVVAAGPRRRAAGARHGARRTSRG